MKIELDRDDLIEESKDKNCSQIGYFDFPSEIRDILIAATSQDVLITFWEYDRRNYNRIIVPTSFRLT
jgi:hypothetical protein